MDHGKGQNMSNSGVPSFFKSALGLALISTLLSACQLSGTSTNTGSSTSNLSTSDASLLYVSKQGDTMTGTLNLPADGLVVGTSELVLTGGNVGIGTAAPAHPLDVYDNLSNTPLSIHSSSSDSGGGNTFILDNTSAGHMRSRLSFQAAGSEVWDLGNDSSNSGMQDFFLYDSVANQVRFYVDPNGNVGIGNITPQATLDVSGLMRLPQQPAGTTPACGATNNGAIAITHAYIGCVCNGASWVKLADGATVCVF